MKRPKIAPPRARPAHGRLPSLVVPLLAVGLLLPSIAAAAERQATPAPDQEASSQELTTDRLISSPLEQTDLPCSADTVALTRITLPPGQAAAAPFGTHLFFVESGALTVQEYVARPTGEPMSEHGEIVPAGPPVTHETGEQFLVTPPDGPQPATITSDGTESAVALVVSIADMAGQGQDGLWRDRSLLVEPLVAEAPVRVESVPGTSPHVSLVRVRYDRGASFDFDTKHMWPSGLFAQLLTVESGALNAQADRAARYRPAGAAPQELPPSARVSLLPGDLLGVDGPGTIATRNVARGPSAALMITISQVSGIVPPVPGRPCT
jgi:hypothetical protein